MTYFHLCRQCPAPLLYLGQSEHSSRQFERTNYTGPGAQLELERPPPLAHRFDPTTDLLQTRVDDGADLAWCLVSMNFCVDHLL